MFYEINAKDGRHYVRAESIDYISPLMDKPDLGQIFYDLKVGREKLRFEYVDSKLANYEYRKIREITR